MSHTAFTLVATFVRIARESGVGQAFARTFAYLLFASRHYLATCRVGNVEAKEPSPPCLPPVASFLMVVTSDASADVVDLTIRSVQAQTCGGWELCIFDVRAKNVHAVVGLERWRGSDPRLKIIRDDENLSVEDAILSACEFATGVFAAVIGPGENLQSDTVQRLSEAERGNPLSRVFYLKGSLVQPGLELPISAVGSELRAPAPNEAHEGASLCIMHKSLLLDLHQQN